MLGKLFKYEMRATAKLFVWLYIAFAAIAIVNALVGPNAAASFGATAVGGDGGDVQILNQTQNVVPNVLQGIVIFLYVLSIIAITVVTLVVVIQRFYKNLLGDEGYLMMTLPVSREQHILSKLSAAMIWFVCSTVLVALSVLLLIARFGGLAKITEGINEMLSAGVPVGRYVFLFIVLIIISCLTGILMMYAAMAVGPNLIKNRVGGSILAYIIICIVSQLVYFGVLLGMASALVGSKAIFTNTNISGYMASNPTSIVDTLVGGSIIYCAIMAVGCWFLTRYMLKRKLNLA